MPPKPFTFELPADLAAKVDEVAARKGITRDDAMRQLLQARLNDEDAKHRLTLEGLADVDAGRVVPHEAVQTIAAGISERDPRQVSDADNEPKRRGLGRKPKRRRLPRGWAKGLEFEPPEPETPPKRRRKDDGPIVVTDDWDGQIPITDAELRVIEGYFRKELDELFGPLP